MPRVYEWKSWPERGDGQATEILRTKIAALIEANDSHTGTGASTRLWLAAVNR
jgi:hypothetical protein